MTVGRSNLLTRERQLQPERQPVLPKIETLESLAQVEVILKDLVRIIDALHRRTQELERKTTEFEAAFPVITMGRYDGNASNQLITVMPGNYRMVYLVIHGNGCGLTWIYDPANSQQHFWTIEDGVNQTSGVAMIEKTGLTLEGNSRLNYPGYTYWWFAVGTFER